MRLLIAVFLSCLVAPAIANISNVQVEADYIQKIHDAHDPVDKLDRSRAVEIAEAVELYSDKWGCDFDLEIAQLGYESWFINNIRDRTLAFKSWSYGYTGMQLGTAKDLNKELKLGYEISGALMIKNFDMNIELGCAQMANLKKKNKGSTKKALKAYNVGQRGMMNGNGQLYYEHIKQAKADWLKFKRDELR